MASSYFYMSKPSNFTITFAFSVGLLAAIHFAQFFGLLTFIASLTVFGKLELDRNTHEIGFYTEAGLSKSVRRWFVLYAGVEVVVRSAICSILAVLLFSGTEALRINLLAVVFVACVFLGFYLLRVLQRLSSIDVTRWGYVRLSVLLGIVFSVLSTCVPGIEVGEIAWKTSKNLMMTLNFKEFAELLYGVVQKVDLFLGWLLQALLGRLIGSLVSLVISVNVLFGFVVFLYALLLFRLIGPKGVVGDN